MPSQPKNESDQSLSSRLSRLLQPQNEGNTDLIIHKRQSLVIRFDPKIRYQLFQAAQVLADVGFHIECLLFTGCCVFASCPADMDLASMLDGVPEIVSWSVS